MRTRRAAALLSVASLVCLPGATAVARERAPTVVAPVRLVPFQGLTLQVDGFHHYLGTIELSSASDGLVIVDRLPLERYLLGLNEVPTDWPMEALRAQAVAARTYALHALESPRAGSAATYGFDICATVACQVFSGADVIRLSSEGHRWATAVASTEGRAILYGGEPILARYHSTSGGRTFDNEVIFPSEGPFPYLQGVESTTEEGSPLYRWRAPFPKKIAQALLVRAGLWSRDEGRLLRARSVDSQFGYHYPDIIFVGAKDSVRISAEGFRDTVRYLAPEMFPRLYPSVALTSTGRLPEVMPSNRVEVITRGDRIIVEGRGWGHGVGMSQWGAEGMARAGSTYEEILDHYYTDVEISDHPDPGPIEVGVAYAQQKVAITGSFELRDGKGRVVEKDALGTWVFRPSGPGAVAVIPPRGFGLPLTVGVIRAPDRVEPGDRVELAIALSAPARVRVASEGEPGPTTVQNAGRSRVVWAAPDEPGTYRLQVIAADGKTRRTDEVEIVVARQGGPPEGPTDGPIADRASRPPLAPLLAVLAITAGAALLVYRKVTMNP